MYYTLALQIEVLEGDPDPKTSWQFGSDWTSPG